MNNLSETQLPHVQNRDPNSTRGSTMDRVYLGPYLALKKSSINVCLFVLFILLLICHSSCFPWDKNSLSSLCQNSAHSPSPSKVGSSTPSPHTSLHSTGKEKGSLHLWSAYHVWASWVAQQLKNLPGMQQNRVQSLGWEEPLEEGMATHFSILAWRIPWTEEPGGIQSMRLERAGDD